LIEINSDVIYRSVSPCPIF